MLTCQHTPFRTLVKRNTANKRRRSGAGRNPEQRCLDSGFRRKDDGYALQLWRLSIPIPKCSDHPARQWLDARQLWRPDLPLPGPVRWISAEHLHHDYLGAGAVIAMAAQPTSWTQAWPNLPELSCIQLVFVAQDGSPAMYRGLNKRTYAGTQGAIVILGCPHLQDAPAPVDVAEGLADALALAARSSAPAVATLGTAGMTSATIADWLATSPATRVSAP